MTHERGKECSADAFGGDRLWNVRPPYSLRDAIPVPLQEPFSMRGIKVSFRRISTHSNINIGFVQRVGQIGLVIALIATMVPQGSPRPEASLISAIFFGSIATYAACLSGKRDLPALANETLFLCGFVGAYAVFQTLSFYGNPFANPIWLRAEKLLGSVNHSISVEPSSTYSALPGTLLPLIAFYATLKLFDDDRSAQHLIKIIAVIGGLFFVYGIVEMLLSQKGRLVSIRAVGSLTGFFVNRNTSGTLLGISSLASLAWFMTAMGWFDRYGRKPSTMKASRRPMMFASAFCLAASVLGLFLTLSRGAMIAWIVSFAVFISLVANYSGGFLPRFMSRWSRRSRLMVAISVSMIGVIVIAEIFGGRIAARFDASAADFSRLCVYKSTWDGIIDNWAFGTGLGTFDIAFQQYRLAGCGPNEKFVSRAHNTFLEALFCLGIIAVPIFVYAYFKLATLLLRGYRRRLRLRHYPVAGIAGVTLVTIHSCTDFSLQIPGFSAYFACFLGAIIAICANARADQSHAPGTEKLMRVKLPPISPRS